jgi:hypothetical protein
MSDSSIPSDLVDQDTVKLRLAEERRQARLQEQSEYRRSNTLLCDCSSCINARELKASNVGVSDGGGTRRPPVALPNASIFSRN